MLVTCHKVTPAVDCSRWPVVQRVARRWEVHVWVWVKECPRDSRHASPPPPHLTPGLPVVQFPTGFAPDLGERRDLWGSRRLCPYGNLWKYRQTGSFFRLTGARRSRDEMAPIQIVQGPSLSPWAAALCSWVLPVDVDVRGDETEPVKPNVLELNTFCLVTTFISFPDVKWLLNPDFQSFRL